MATGMNEFRFNVYGTLVAVRAVDGGWQAFILGAEGKRRPAEFVVPDFIAQEDLCQYLADLFHENAMPGNGDVTQIK